MAEESDFAAAGPSPAPAKAQAPTPAEDPPFEGAVAPPPSTEPTAADAPPQFDPSRMIGIIKRKALIKELAAMYHAECLSCCRELLDLQKKWEEQPSPEKAFDQPRRETSRLSKRTKKNY